MITFQLHKDLFEQDDICYREGKKNSIISIAIRLSWYLVI